MRDARNVKIKQTKDRKLSTNLNRTLNIQYRNNLSGGGRAVLYGQTGRHDEATLATPPPLPPASETAFLCLTIPSFLPAFPCHMSVTKMK